MSPHNPPPPLHNCAYSDRRLRGRWFHFHLDLLVRLLFIPFNNPIEMGWCTHIGPLPLAAAAGRGVRFIWTLRFQRPHASIRGVYTLINHTCMQYCQFKTHCAFCAMKCIFCSVYLDLLGILAASALTILGRTFQECCSSLVTTL